MNIISNVFFILLTQMTLKSTYTPAPYSHDVNVVQDIAAKEIKNKLPLHPAGSGASCMDSIKSIYLAFQCDKLLDVEQARKYLIFCTETLLKIVNEKESIHPYMTPYPFTDKNVEIALFIKAIPLFEATLDDLRIVSLENGVIIYEAIERKTFQSRVLHRESYEEALEIVGDISEVEREYRESKLSHRIYKKCTSLFTKLKRNNL